MTERSALAPYTGDAMAAYERAESLQVRVDELEEENRKLCEEIELVAVSVQEQDKTRRRWWKFWRREGKGVSQEEIEKLIEEKNKIISDRGDSERAKLCADFLSWFCTQNSKIPKAKDNPNITLYKYRGLRVSFYPGQNVIRSSLDAGWSLEDLVDKLISDGINLDKFERKVKKNFSTYIKSI